MVLTDPSSPLRQPRLCCPLPGPKLPAVPGILRPQLRGRPPGKRQRPLLPARQAVLIRRQGDASAGGHNQTHSKTWAPKADALLAPELQPHDGRTVRVRETLPGPGHGWETARDAGESRPVSLHRAGGWGHDPRVSGISRGVVGSALLPHTLSSPTSGWASVLSLSAPLPPCPPLAPLLPEHQGLSEHPRVCVCARVPPTTFLNGGNVSFPTSAPSAGGVNGRR